MSSNSFKTNGAYTATGGAVRRHLDKFLAILESAEMLAGPSVPASLRKSLVVALSQRLSDLWSPMDDGIDFLEAIGEESELYGLLAQIEDELEADEETLGDEADKELGEEDFTTDNETGSKSEKVGGGLNKLDEVKYTFGLVADGRRTKDPDGTFASYFKEDKEVDDQYGKHRGSRSDIPQNKPEFGKRSLAMYQLDQLLSASLVPPTFRASREGRIGIVMEKVAGRKALADETNRNVLDGKSATEAEMLQPQVREAMSNLSLLDYIAGQVDRHPGNYLIVKQPDGTIDVKAIDNDLAFGVKYLEMVDQVDGASAAIRSEVTAGVLPIMLKEIDSAFAQRIIALASIPKILDDALWGLLSSEEIEATKARLSRLADFLQPLITQNDDRVVTKWG